jgi:hypothetical protein
MPHSRIIRLRRFRPVWLTLVALAATLAVGSTPAAAQPAPKSLSKYVKKVTLTPDETSAMSAFVDRYASDLADADPRLHAAARQKLMMDLHGMAGNRATPAFRGTYADLVLPKLAGIVADGTVPQSIASCQVAGGLGTDSAVTFLSKHLAAEREPRTGVRMWAVASLRPLIAQPNVTPTRIARVLRDVGHAAATETDWTVLRQQLKTLAAAVENARSADNGRAEILDTGQTTQAEVLHSVIQRLRNGDLDMLNVLEPHMQHVQQQFLDQRNPAMVRSFAETTGPVLRGLYEAILANWEALSVNEQAAALAGRTLDQGEVMIVLMDNETSGGSATAAPAYGQAISKGDRTLVEAGRDRWGPTGG